MLKWSALWIAILCVVTVSVSTGQHMKQTSHERLTVERLSKEVVHIDERSTFIKRIGNAARVEKLVRKAGVTSDKMIIAVLVNGWLESNWNPREDDGLCVGFFQLHVKYMGEGCTKKQLQNLNYNTLKLIHSKDFKDWVKWCKVHHGSCGDISYRFASRVERCAYRFRLQRKRIADRWYRGITAQKSRG